MPIHFEHAVEVAREPDRVFGVLDDLTKTPKWLARCTGIEKLTPGANAIGTKLRYSYCEGGRSGVMDGEITARKLKEALAFRYFDKMMEVTVGIQIRKASSGSRLVHTIEITPKTFFAKLLSPLIRRQLPKQTITAMETLKGLLESDNI